MQNKNQIIITRSKLEILRFLWDIIIFRLFAYFLNMFKPTSFIQHFKYIDFRIILTQIYINFSIQEHQIDVSCIFQRLRFSYFIIYPLSFFLYSLFKRISWSLISDLMGLKNQGSTVLTRKISKLGFLRLAFSKPGFLNLIF